MCVPRSSIAIWAATSNNCMARQHYAQCTLGTVQTNHEMQMGNLVPRTSLSTTRIHMNVSPLPPYQLNIIKAGFSTTGSRKWHPISIANGNIEAKSLICHWYGMTQ